MGQNHFNLSSKVALVTGGASGIGAATVRALSDAGASVLVADVQVEKGEALAIELRSKDRKVQFVKADMASEPDIKNMVATAIATFGRLDIAFNNAGIESTPGDTASCTTENWDRTLTINLRGVWLCMKYQIPEMLKAGGGSIVNCSSIAGLVAFPGLPAYVASKHAIIGLTKTAAIEYATQNIRVNAVCPGVIDTPMIDRFSKGDAATKKSLGQSEPMGRMGLSEEIASAVLWLSSDASSFVTGHPLVVDGGWVAR